MADTKMFRIAAAAALAVAALALPASAAGASQPAAIPSKAAPHPNAKLDPPIDGIIDITQQRVVVSADKRQKFSYDNEIIYWSVTGIRPAAGLKKADLLLFGEGANKTQLAASKLTGTNVDFIAVDSNHATAPKTWYPTVVSKGSGKYEIQNDTNEGLLTCGLTMAVTMLPTDLITITDTYVARGVESTITANGGGEAQLFVMESRAGSEGSWYQGRGEALASSQGAAGPEKVTFTGDGDYYGIVLVQNSGSGTYSISQDCR
jgi:hypothetical protein